jgi:hypothetical protein
MTDDRQTANDEQLRKARDAFERAIDENAAGTRARATAPAEEEETHEQGPETSQPTGS